MLDTAQATTFLYNCFSGTSPAIGRSSYRHEWSKRLLKSPCSWYSELDPSPFFSTIPHTVFCKQFCSTHFPPGLLSYNCRQICIMLACRQEISAQYMEAVAISASRLEIQSLPWSRLCQGLLVHGSEGSNSRLKRRGTRGRWGSGAALWDWLYEIETG